MSGKDDVVSGFQDVTEVLDYPMFVATTAHEGTAAGCLVGFATQTSIDPPRFLVGLSNKNHTHRVAQHASRLVVHLLDSESKDLARLFGETTGDDLDKFTKCSWRSGADDVPVLDDAPAWFTGRVRERIGAGDHTGFLIDIDGAEVRRRPDRLLRLSDVADFDPGHEA
jgi:flavin reductase (DIM6/NTAB) family NADH-FMN oxidoreductase RutF